MLAEGFFRILESPVKIQNQTGASPRMSVPRRPYPSRCQAGNSGPIRQRIHECLINFQFLTSS